jgi:hypothetical protein
MVEQHHITQHKRFVRQMRTHPNFCFAKTSFVLGTLYRIVGKATKYEATH